MYDGAEKYYVVKVDVECSVSDDGQDETEMLTKITSELEDLLENSKYEFYVGRAKTLHFDSTR